jgi:hypothetical protein
LYYLIFLVHIHFAANFKELKSELNTYNIKNIEKELKENPKKFKEIKDNILHTTILSKDMKAVNKIYMHRSSDDGIWPDLSLEGCVEDYNLIKQYLKKSGTPKVIKNKIEMDLDPLCYALSMAVQKVLNHSGIKVLTSTTFALARNERGDAETRGGYRYEGFIPPGIEHIRDIQDHRIQ